MSAPLRCFRFPLRSRSARYQHPLYPPPEHPFKARPVMANANNKKCLFLIPLRPPGFFYSLPYVHNIFEHKKEPLHHILCDREVRSPYLSGINSVQNILTAMKTILRQISAYPILRHLQCVLPLLYICNSFSNIPVPLFHWFQDCPCILIHQL